MEDRVDNLEQRRAWELGVLSSLRRLLDIVEGEVDAEGNVEDMPSVAEQVYHWSIEICAGIYKFDRISGKED